MHLGINYLSSHWKYKSNVFLCTNKLTMFADIYCNYTYICLFTSFGVTLNVSVAITPLGAAGLLGLCATPSGGTP